MYIIEHQSSRGKEVYFTNHVEITYSWITLKAPIVKKGKLNSEKIDSKLSLIKNKTKIIKTNKIPSWASCDKKWWKFWE